MAYATQADVDALISRYAPTAATTPTITQSALIIDGVNDEIDSAIAGSGYSVPVASPTYFVDYLSFLNSIGAAAAILRAMFPDATDGAEVSAYRFWYDWYTRSLKTLQDGSSIPPEAATNGATIYPSTYLTDNPDTELDLGDIAEPLFKKAQIF